LDNTYVDASTEITPKISVIVPVFNRREFLMKAMVSLKEQTLNKLLYEVVVIKNFYDDYLDLKISEFGFINLFSDGTMGDRLASAISQSKGTIICFLQDDDIFFAEKLELIFNKFSENNEIGFISNGFEQIDQWGNLIKTRNKIIKRESFFSNLDKRDLITISFMIKNGWDFNLSCMSVKKSIIEPYLSDLRQIEGADDSFVFFISLFQEGSLYRIEKPITKYRLHNSATNKFGKIDVMLMKNYSTFKRQVKTFKLLYNLAPNKIFKEIIKSGIMEREIVIEIVSPHKIKIGSTYSKIKWLVNHNHTSNMKFIIKLIFETIISTISKKIGKYSYYTYMKLKFSENNNNGTGN
jgi:glycosyltransferase involved in cell wall biosynthesis